MRQHSSFIGIFVICCGFLTSGSNAQAANETWVSGTGTDTGNCPITAPCRTFAFAHTQTNNNGAINVLTSGNFGPLTITKPISIVADGVEAVINTAADGAAIIVQTGGSAVISLRGLTIDMRGTDNRGIAFVSGGTLHVQNCVIRRAETGIEFDSATGTPELYVADSVIANATNTTIFVRPTGSGGASVVLDRVWAENGLDNGIILSGSATTGSISATVRNSVMAGNAGLGIWANEAAPGSTTVMIDRSTVVNNKFNGIIADGGAVIRIGDSTVTGNGIGLQTADGARSFLIRPTK
jgi:hypothetical protein